MLLVGLHLSHLPAVLIVTKHAAPWMARFALFMHCYFAELIFSQKPCFAAVDWAT